MLNNAFLIENLKKYPGLHLVKREAKALIDYNLLTDQTIVPSEKYGKIKPLAMNVV